MYPDKYPVKLLSGSIGWRKMQRALGDELKHVLGIDDTQELSKYILSLETEADQVDYLSQVLGDRSKADAIAHKIGLQLRNVKVKRVKKQKKKKTVNPIMNCLSCGKIEFNGGRDCTFCSNPLLFWGESDEEDEFKINSAAELHKDRLLQYDQTSAQRTHVFDIDDNYDEDEVEENNTTYNLTFDFAGRRVIPELKGRAQDIFNSLRRDVAQL